MLFFRQLFNAQRRVSIEYVTQNHCQKLYCGHVRSVTTKSEQLVQVKPKPGITPYAAFQRSKVRDVIADLKRDGERDRVQQQAFKIVAQLWKELPDHEKQVYIEESLAEKEKIQREFDQMSDDEKLKLYESQQTAKAKMLDKKIKKQEKEIGKPTVPKSAWNHYCQEHLSGVARDQLADKFRQLSESFKSLPQDIKQKYVLLAKQDSERYAVEMTQYIVRAEEQGKDSLISSRIKRKYLNSRDDAKN